MIIRTELGALFDDKNKAAEEMGDFFIRMMGDRISGDWERDLEEDVFSRAGFESFIEYACNGLSCEQFLGYIPEPWFDLDLERINCVIYFLESLGIEKQSDILLKNREKSMVFILRFLETKRIRGTSISNGVMDSLKVCLEELKKESPDKGDVRALAELAKKALVEERDRLYCVQLVDALELKALVGEIRDPLSPLKRLGDLDSVKLTSIRGLLEQIQKISNDLEGENSNEGSREMLESLSEMLRKGARLEAFEVKARQFEGLVSEKMQEIADGLKKGLSVKPPSKKHMKDAYLSFLKDITPYKGERKCRPYELFLFAAQNGLMEDKLIKRRSELNSEFTPNAPDALKVSILESHKGVPF